ncbi:hypothetical protein QJS10_CPA06g00380 [Acorus calamus]|uniref:Uncharacterized protein n=1 Tax=Acorus calamus TaxID=4465 RepID=A0AAV9EJU5_ACOCL|nr:hypothetical protein QJS10_CPA06g00380 [Acorus calamus]
MKPKKIMKASPPISASTHLPLSRPRIRSNLSSPIGNPQPPWTLHPPIARGNPFPRREPRLLLQVKENRQGVPTTTPIGRAVSSLADMLCELQRSGLGEGTGTVERALGETRESCFWMFRSVFSDSPNMVVSLLMLLAECIGSSTDENREILCRMAEYERVIAKGEKGNSLILSNYAQFLYRFAVDLHRAERYFKLAVQAEPVDAEAMSRYAEFLWKERGDLEGAEEMFLAAADAEPGSHYHTGNYASFLWRTGAEDTCYPLDPPELL